MDETTEQENRLYTMKLHETISLGNRKTVLRVPGGWIYYDRVEAPGPKEQLSTSGVVFVPFDAEFKVHVGFVGRKMPSR